MCNVPNIWGFTGGDTIQRKSQIITVTEFSFRWNDSTQVVKFYGLFENKNWLETREVLIVSNPDGIVLLIRPGLKFKVGDKVAVYINKCLADGFIAVIDPFSTKLSEFYIVEFPNLNFAEYGELFWDKPWYPNNKKNKDVSRLILSGDLLANKGEAVVGSEVVSDTDSFRNNILKGIM